MKRSFIESDFFRQFMKNQQVDDTQLLALQLDIMSGSGDAVPGTGGLKKIRWGRRGSGKRGGYRVLFADYKEFGITVLLSAYLKSVKTTLNAGEANHWREIKTHLDREMRRING